MLAMISRSRILWCSYIWPDPGSLTGVSNVGRMRM